MKQTTGKRTEPNKRASYEIVGVFMGRSALCIEMNEFRRGKRAPFLWFFDIWKLSQEPDRDRESIVGALSAHNAFLLELLTLMGISVCRRSRFV